MSEHLTEWDMMRYAEMRTVTPENVEFAAQVNCHVMACEKCKLLLDIYCEMAETSVDTEMTR